jgi:hypothetical protein
MKTLWKIIARHPFLLVSMVLLVLLVLQRECTHQPTFPDNDTITLVSTTTDTLIITHNHYLPPPPPDTVIHDDTIFPDTAAILADYSALKIYNRTLLDDSSGKISVLDSVQFNSLLGSQLSAVLFQKHTIETITHTVYQTKPQKLKLYAGLSISLKYPPNYLLIPQVALLNRKGCLYSLAFNPTDKVFITGIMWNIKVENKRN